MNWDDCLKNKIKKIQPDTERAKSLTQIAQKRLESIKRRRQKEYPEFIVEEYYETIKELITALLLEKGYKSYSHECLITYLRENHNIYSEEELDIIDQLRNIRHNIQYRGEPLAKDYLKRRENQIQKIIKKLQM
jgi:uncharacterized protein (UPF0332 family)